METLFIGRNCIRLSEIDSTNTYASNLLKEVNVPDGTLILTEHQTNGRGQRGAHWMAEPGSNITCSLIIHPNFLTLNNHFIISKIIALSIQKTIQDILPTVKNDIKIKWPNDILVKHQKISGILIENIIQETKIKSSIIGFGINVNQHNFGELQESATSLFNLCGEKFDINMILNKVCSYFEAYYLKLKKSNYLSIHEEYFSNLFLTKTTFSFNDLLTNQTQNGRIIDVESNGLIVIEITPDLQQKKYALKEISFNL